MNRIKLFVKFILSFIPLITNCLGNFFEYEVSIYIEKLQGQKQSKKLQGTEKTTTRLSAFSPILKK